MHIIGNVADFILAQLAEWGVKRIRKSALIMSRRWKIDSNPKQKDMATNVSHVDGKLSELRTR